ncbi:LexA family protein [Sphingomonas paucimobilis]|uniref:LexA family protein n=1 Tax=Sphingomonas paucimobilis TaxID=13689 RepID=UPI00069E1283|nr:S24 family peptidase [Sphingomonas paucimobilis]
MFVIDAPLRNSQCAFMVTHDELMRTLHNWISTGKARQKDIADELKIAPPRVSEMLRGARRIQQDEMPILARYFGLEEPENSNVRKIKRVGRVPAGQLRQALADSEDTVVVGADLPKDVFALEVDGESMNLLAPFGADVIVDPNDKSLFAGDLYVIGDGEGGFTFKQFMQDPARLVPLSDDPAHRDILIGAAPLDIVGRVVSLLIGAGNLRKMARDRQA